MDRTEFHQALVDRPDPIIAKVPPGSLEFETSFLGGCLADPDQIGRLEVRVEAEFFTDAWNGKAWLAMQALVKRDAPIDVVTLNDELKKTSADDPDRVSHTADSMLTGANVNHYARKLKGLHLRRELIIAGRQISSLAYDSMLDTQGALAEAEAVLAKIATELEDEVRVDTASDLAQRAFEHVEAVHAGVKPGVRSGFYGLDALTSGFQPGEVSLLAARPSTGKTTFANEIVRNALEAGHRCAFVSLETSNRQLALNWAARASGISGTTLKHSGLNQDERARFQKALDVIDGYGDRLNSIDRGVRSVAELRRQCRIWASRKVELVVIDYLQLMTAKSDKRYEVVTEISMALKEIAVKCNMHVLAVAQLNRGSENRTNTEPRMSDLRESGQLEQDADVVMIMHRPGRYDESLDPNETDLIVAKNRNGPIGKVKLIFDMPRNKFSEVAPGIPD